MYSAGLLTAIAAPAQPVVASAALAAVLAAPASPARVLGASRTALYVGLDRPTAVPGVVAIVAADGVRLPNALVLRGRLPVVPTTAPARVGSGEVTVGGLRWRPVRWVDPRPRLDGPVEPRLLAETRHRLALLPDDAFGVAPQRADGVARDLAGGDPAPALGLVGLGPGLTPAGDDLVAGVLAALALLGRPQVAAVDAVLMHAAGATTALSAALLRCAAAGQVLPQAARLLRALCGRGVLGVALRDLVAVGSTSGAAMALGLIAGAQAAQTTSVGASM